MRILLLVTLLALASPLHSNASVEYDALNDEINCGSADILDEAQPFSMSGWFFPTGTGESGGGRFFSKSTGNTSAGAWFLRYNTGVLTFNKLGSTNIIVTTVESPTLNAWNHIAVTWDGSVTATNVHIYINGTEATYSAQTNGATLGSDAGYSYMIGNNDDGGRTFQGLISEQAFWRGVVLNQNEIRSLASGVRGLPLTIQKNNLVGYWPLNERPDGVAYLGSECRDRSGYGNHGTQVGNPVGRADSKVTYQ